jgi:hypothetical protein
VKRLAIFGVGALLCGASFPQAALTAGVSNVEHLFAQRAIVTSPLERALEAALVNGKPVLVIVTDPAPILQPCASRWLPDVIVAGGDSLLQTLALVEVAFATREQLRAVLHAVNKERAEHGDVGLLETIASRRVWTPIEVEAGPRCAARDDDAKELGRQMEAVALELERHILADRAVTRRRARHARRGLSEEQLEELRTSLARKGRADLELMDRCAWCYRESVLEARGHELGAWGPTFVGLAALRLVDRPPFGARWFQRDDKRLRVDFLEQDDEIDRARLLLRARNAVPIRGSLTVLRPDPSDFAGGRMCCMGPCGTGFTPKPSYRFLDEYTRALVSAADLD